MAKAHGEVGPRSYRGATLVELMHTATLVHDDVVDESAVRRSMFSINALWKNKIAVLVGDYMLSRVLLRAVESGDYDLLRMVSTAVRAMSEGELLQIEKARRLDIDESVYYDIIQKRRPPSWPPAAGLARHRSGRTRPWFRGLRPLATHWAWDFRFKTTCWTTRPTGRAASPRALMFASKK